MQPAHPVMHLLLGRAVERITAAQRAVDGDAERERQLVRAGTVRVPVAVDAGQPFGGRLDAVEPLHDRRRQQQQPLVFGKDHPVALDRAGKVDPLCQRFERQGQPVQAPAPRRRRRRLQRGVQRDAVDPGTDHVDLIPVVTVAGEAPDADGGRPSGAEAGDDPAVRLRHRAELGKAVLVVPGPRRNGEQRLSLQIEPQWPFHVGPYHNRSAALRFW